MKRIRLLAGRPMKGSPPQKMEVEMVDGLAAVSVTIDDEPVSPLRKPLFPGKRISHQNQFPDERSGLFGKLRNPLKMGLGDNHGMERGLGINVSKGEDLLIVMEKGGRDLFLDNSTEDAIFHRLSIAGRPACFNKRCFKKILFEVK